MQFVSSEAIPWFGMPGGGRKYHVRSAGAEVPIRQLMETGSFEELEIISLTQQNADVLQKRGKYFFFQDTAKLTFDSGRFFADGKEIKFSDAFEKGLLKIMRPLNRE